jgi:L-ascorbate metabolism protein UlaG (beta-lactamase superfamily)
MSPDRVTWGGHATVLLELAGARLLTDPVLRSRVAHLRRHGEPPSAGLAERLDAVLISHLHYDHLDLPSLRGIAGEATAFAPLGAAALLRRAGFGSVEEVRPGESGEVAGVRVSAVPAAHDPRRRPLGTRAEPVGFVLEAGPRIYFAGDTDLFEGMSEIGPVDLALIPVAGWGPELGSGGHLDPESAARAVALIRPAVAVPIHWGTLYPRGRRLGDWFTEPGRRFAAHAAELAPGVDVRVLSPGESLAL